MSEWALKSPAEKVDAIKKCWYNGASASKIAALAGAGSRQAIIGIYHRNRADLVDHPLSTPVKSKNKKAKTFTQKKIVEDKEIEIVDPVQQGQVISIQDSDRIATGITLMQFTKNTCKWCVSDYDYIFCGEWTDQAPYCEEHRKRSKTIGTLSERMAEEKHLEKYINR